MLTANPLCRYLLNSPMLRTPKREPDGGLTLYIQNESPGADKQANWLLAPKGPFWGRLRLYWPKEKHWMERRNSRPCGRNRQMISEP
jgi:hypothetical protein